MQYQLWKSDKDNNWYWRFITNGNVIFRGSEGYVNRVDAVRGIEIARGSARAETVEQGSDGKWYQMA